jgi:superfamily II DNA or RNA helicase
LWPHQLEALELIEAFIRARRRAAGGSALIRMPTGTGKSGVIAVTAHTLTGRGHVLVLAPWDALVDQLARDIRERFWARIGVDAPSAREVYRVLPSSADATFDGARKPSIFIATITSLRQLQNRRPKSYARLGALISLVMVDEGHYEPAPDWSRAVRGLGQPVILFTATPYRNDFKFFDVDRKFFYSYSHERAERDRFVRKLSFDDAAFSTPAAFCAGLLAFCKQTFGQNQPRVIVRCASENSVRELTTTLAAKGCHGRRYP